MESERKKVKTVGGGFGETRFEFDEAEVQYTTERKKYQKAALRHLSSVRKQAVAATAWITRRAPSR